MRISENDDGNDFLFACAQVAYHADTRLGEGAYRVTFSYATDEFLDAAGASTEPRFAVILSADQRLGEVVGVRARAGVQDDDAAVTHRSLVSAGLDIGGKLWGREQDNFGLGYAYLDGGNAGVSATHAIEAYARVAITPRLALTADVRYLADHLAGDSSVTGFILGGRLVFEF